MTQQRIQDYGSPVIAQNLKDLANALTANSAVIEGFTFSVASANRVRIAPGKAITTQGVVILEDEDRFVDIENTTNSVDYTVYYMHEDRNVSGGVAADLVIVQGILEPATITGTILGYIRYPGQAVPLDTSHFIQAIPYNLGEYVPSRTNVPWLIPFNNNYIITESTGGNLDITDTWDTTTDPNNPELYLKIRNNGNSVGTVTITFPFKVGTRPFSLVQIRSLVETATVIQPFFIDSAGGLNSLAPGGLSESTALTNYQLNIPTRANQQSNTLVYLQIQAQLILNKEFRLQALGMSDYNLPF